MKYFRLLFGCFYQDTKGNKKKKIGISVNQGEILIVHVHHAALLVYQRAVCVSPFTYCLTDLFCTLMYVFIQRSYQQSYFTTVAKFFIAKYGTLTSRLVGGTCHVMLTMPGNGILTTR